MNTSMKDAKRLYRQRVATADGQRASGFRRWARVNLFAYRTTATGKLAKIINGSKEKT